MNVLRSKHAQFVLRKVIFLSLVSYLLLLLFAALTQNAFADVTVILMAVTGAISVISVAGFVTYEAFRQKRLNRI